MAGIIQFNFKADLYANEPKFCLHGIWMIMHGLCDVIRNPTWRNGTPRWRPNYFSINPTLKISNNMICLDDKILRITIDIYTLNVVNRAKKMFVSTPPVRTPVVRSAVTEF